MHKNLHLALLDNLMEAGIIERFDLDAYFLKHRGVPFDPDDFYDFKPLPDVETCLLNIDLKDADLARLTEVTVEAGQQLQHDILPSWDGEDDYFDVPSLDGIQRCHNAKRLWLHLLPPELPIDLEPLRSLRAVESITVNGGMLLDLEPILTMVNLRKLEFYLTLIQDSSKNRAVLEHLRGRGCMIANKTPRGMKFE